MKPWPPGLNVGDAIPIEDFLGGDSPILRKVRWRVFTAKGVQCSSPDCSTTGTHAVKWRDKGGGVHFDLFAGPVATVDGMLTLDHHVPKSLGGPMTVENLNPMCHACNSRKRNTLPLDVRQDFIAGMCRILAG